MAVIRKYMILLLAVILIAGCKHKKKPSLSGEEPVEISDFIEFFQPVTLIYLVADSVLQRKEKDSLLISYKVFTQFVPDSVLGKVYGKGIKPKIYPLGKAEASGAETYLFVKTITNDKKAVFILCFDKKQQFITGMAVLRPDQSSTTLQTAALDKKYTITQTVLRKNPDGSLSEGKNVYVLNAEAKNFMLIMTEALDDKVTELINPIDTLPRKNKFAADYGIGKMNLISIRDGRKNDRLTFFIHFEKNNGECTGELKGEAMLLSPGVAEYREDGDPCVMKFKFTSTAVSVTEENCGSHRGLKCLFEGSFGRKKYVQPVGSSKPAGKK
jgi:hypothetical protein